MFDPPNELLGVCTRRVLCLKGVFLVDDVLWSVFIEENQNRREDYIEDSPYGESAEFTQKGEDVFSSFEDHAENLVKNTLQIEFHGNDMEWRSKEELLRKPF